VKDILEESMSKKNVLAISIIALLILAAVLVMRLGHKDVYADKALSMVGSMKSGDFQKATKDLAHGGMSPDQLRAWWNGVEAQYGPLADYSLQYAGPVKNDPNNVYGVRIRCNFGKGTKWMVIKFHTTGGINSYGVYDTAANNCGFDEGTVRPDLAKLTNEQVAQNVVESLKAGKFENAERDFHRDLALLLTPKQFEQAWSKLTAKCGALQTYSIVKQGPEPNSGRYGMCLACKFEKATKWMVIKLESTKQIYKFGIYDTPQ